MKLVPQEEILHRRKGMSFVEQQDRISSKCLFRWLFLVFGKLSG